MSGANARISSTISKALCHDAGMNAFPTCWLALLLAPSLVMAANWPQWRGPSGNGVAAAGDYPVEFSPEKNVAWKTELPGLGSSTPAVWGDRLFVTGGIRKDAANEEDAPRDDGVVCYDLAGNELWRVLLGQERAGKHRNASGSNPSPVTDGDHVYVYFKSGRVAALDFGGKVKWQKNLQELYGEDTLWWDLGSSPALSSGAVIIAVMQAGDSYLVAFDKTSGDELWKTSRQYECRKETDQSYATPLIAKSGDAEHVVTWGADHLTAHDVKTGELVWECGGFNPNNEALWRVIATPSISDGIAVVPYGRAKRLAAVRLGGEGDVTKTNRLWEKEGLGADVPCPVAHAGKAYLLSDSGELFCFDLKSGKEIWKKRLPRKSSKYYASPILAGDVMFCTREDGVIFAIKIKDDGFDLIGENDMQERLIATQVPINDRVLIRGTKHLFCIGSK